MLDSYRENYSKVSIRRGTPTRWWQTAKQRENRNLTHKLSRPVYQIQATEEWTNNRFSSGMNKSTHPCTLLSIYMYTSVQEWTLCTLLTVISFHVFDSSANACHFHHHHTWSANLFTTNVWYINTLHHTKYIPSVKLVNKRALEAGTRQLTWHQKHQKHQ